MLGLDPEIGASMLRVWVAAGSAALLVLIAALAFFWSRSGVLRAGFVLIGAVLGVVMTAALLERSGSAGGGAERRALELRAQELSGRALAPGSPLACLDAVAGETVEAACEKAIFVSPASVASASSYVAARLALLAGMAAYARRGGANIDDVMLPLRRSLEADRFGFVAHVLAVRDGCTSQKCKPLALLDDASRVRANLGTGELDHYVDHYQELWAKAADGSVAEGAAPPKPSARKMVDIDFPSAASIPPVSIMNPEPTGPVLPGAAAAAAANPNGTQAPAAHARHARKQAANPPPQAAVEAAPAATEPIWPEPLPPPPPRPAAQTAAAPAGPPVQLSPPLPAGAARAQ